MGAGAARSRHAPLSHHRQHGGFGEGASPRRSLQRDGQDRRQRRRVGHSGGSSVGRQVPARSGVRGQSARRERRFIRTAGFFRALPPLVVAALPTRLKGVSHRARSSQAQWFFGDPRLHFEAWWHANTGRLELGLHLEAEPATNDRIAAGLARQLLMIKARLGQQLDLESWDRGWIRLYETTAIEVFDAAQVERTAARIAELIVVIWPMCQELRKGDAKIRLAVRE